MTDLVTAFEDGIAFVQLSNPNRRNPLSREVQEGILAALDESVSRRTKAVVIRGSGPAFSAGYNLDPKSRAAYIESPDIFDDLAGLRRSADFLLKVRRHPYPVITQVSGYCLAGGTDLMLASDIAIASASARIGVPNVRSLGISLLSTLWPLHIGPMRSKLLMFTGDWITGEQADRWGLVALSVPDEELDAYVRRLAQRIAHLPPDLLKTVKLAGNRALDTVGVEQLVSAALEIDVISHFSHSVKDFWQDVRLNGLTPCLRQRDAAFDDAGNLASELVRFGQVNRKEPSQ